MPGRTSSPRPARVAWATASAPAWDNSPNSSRLLRKSGRSRRGMVSTTCRWGTGASSFSLSHSAHRSCFFFSHDGQKERPRQENGTRTLVRHVLHQSRAKPCSIRPQVRNARRTRSTTDRSGRGPWRTEPDKRAGTLQGAVRRGGRGGIPVPAGVGTVAHRSPRQPTCRRERPARIKNESWVCNGEKSLPRARAETGPPPGLGDSGGLDGGGPGPSSSLAVHLGFRRL